MLIAKDSFPANWIKGDSQGNLRQVTLEDGRRIDYAIDPDNRRTGKRTNGQLQWQLVWQDQLRPIARLKADHTLKATYIYADKPNVPEAMQKNGKTYRIVSDPLGSVRLVIDSETGDVAQQLDYDAWGQVMLDTNPGFQPFGYAGGLYDPDTGLTRFGARDYDGETGRWTAKDPILFEGGDSNLFGYVRGNPLLSTDPDGLRPNRPQWWNDAWGPITPPGHCVTAECAAGLPPTPSDNRSREEMEFGQCKMVCQISLAAPVAMCNAAAGGGLLGTAAAAAAKGSLCTWVCK